MTIRNLNALARSLGCAIIVTLSVSALAQTPQLEPTPRFALPDGPLTIHEPAIPNRPFTVTGASGAILGMQDGTVELWQFPLKFFSGLRIRAEVDGYPIPIDMNAAAADIDVSPGHTTITYSHAAITIRQHMFVPTGQGNEGQGGVILFEIESIHPATITISLVPALQRMWPAPQYGQPGWDWRPMGTGGAYVIGTDNPQVFGVIGMANSTHGYISPYQEHPHTLPLEFRLRFDPKRDSGFFFPLLCEAAGPGERNTPEAIAAMQQRIIARSQALPQIYARTQAYYAHFFDDRLVVHTPSAPFDTALQWAELAIDKAQVTTPRGETGLVAGWYPSFDSTRPGFGWFFGRDTLWTVYAIDSYGDPALVRRAIDFLVKRQRADGKMMHEYSQSADDLTGALAWSNFPYEYAAADSTPLYLLAMQDYVRTTGDLDYLRSHWDSLKLAYHFERTHDSDGDGVYDNSQGTGWVEGWPPKPPHQELYLAALDRDATAAMSRLAALMHDDALATEAAATASKLAAAVEAYRQPNGTYAFSKNADGTYDPTLTVYPSVALWSSGTGFAHPATMLSDWSSHLFATDWGSRSVSETDPIYDPISYHQGTVWPLFTGWTAMAQYNAGRPLAGWAALQHNVNLTWAQDPGSVTEVLSGRFYQPLGRSSTHQLWSSAMVLAPAVRGLFGLTPDALRHTLLVNPHLPADWPTATLDHVLVGSQLFTVTMTRHAASLEVTASSQQPTVLCLAHTSDPATTQPCHQPPTTDHHLTLPLPDIEVALAPQPSIEFGDSTHQARIIDEDYSPRSIHLRVEALAETTVTFRLHRNRPTASLHLDGAQINQPGDTLIVKMPPGSGFVQKDVTLTW